MENVRYFVIPLFLIVVLLVVGGAGGSEAASGVSPGGSMVYDIGEGVPLGGSEELKEMGVAVAALAVFFVIVGFILKVLYDIGTDAGLSVEERFAKKEARLRAKSSPRKGKKRRDKRAPTEEVSATSSEEEIEIECPACGGTFEVDRLPKGIFEVECPHCGKDLELEGE